MVKRKKTGGRKKGTPNRVNSEIRDNFATFLHYASPEIIELWDKLREESPRDALNAIKDYADFVLPKISRVEQQTLDKDGEPTDPAASMLAWVAEKDTNDLPNKKDE